jgi:DNA-binding PadR family transcriptional regulator
MRRRRGDLLPLEAEILRLAIELADGGQPRFYGWSIAQRLADESGRETGFGSLYRTLNRLEDLGYLVSQWVLPAQGGQAPKREYEITPDGRTAYATARRTPVSGKLVPRFSI